MAASPKDDHPPPRSKAVPADHASSQPPSRYRARGAVRRVLREPLFHFLITGLLLFVAGRIYQYQTSTYRIVVTPQHVAELANQYALKFGAKPDPQTLKALVDQDIHDEILYRRGLALKLDQDDQIVRRRIVQKMQFLMQDLDAPPEPRPAQLEAYYKTHRDRYTTPPRATFTHIYFSADKGGDAVARQRARAVLANLEGSAKTRAPELGDPFPDLYDFSAYEPEQVQRLFGRSSFSDAVFSAPVGVWGGPYKSGYGWHLVYIAARQAAALPPLSAVRGAVRSDYLQSIQDRTNQAAFDKLAQQFTIVRQDEASK